MALRTDPRLANAPSICEILCQRSSFSDVNSKANTMSTVAGFLDFISKAMDEVENDEALSDVEKAEWPGKMIFKLTQVGTELARIAPMEKELDKETKDLMALNKLCAEKSPSEIEDSCKSQNLDR